MRGGIGQIILLAAGTSLSCGVSAMTASRPSGGPQCRVVTGEKLLAELGGMTAVCGEIAEAMAASGVGKNYKVDLKVISSSRLGAILTVNGRTLPEQHFAVMDARLTRATLKRFAEGLADLAKSEKR